LKLSAIRYERKTCKNNKLTAYETDIKMANLLPPVYYLKVNEGNKAAKTLK